MVFSLGGDLNDAVMVTSGYGDGAYPCYWGIDATGSLTSLVVDFLVLAESHVSVVNVPWRIGQVDAPEIADCDMQITSADGAFVISHNGHRVDNIRVLSADGTPVIDGHRLGLTVQGERHSQAWAPQFPPPPGSILEVTLHSGYRHT